MLKKIITSPVFKYSIIFLLLLFVSTFTTILGNDEVWNFGFIKNVHDGLIPYKDFNMVITPFYPIFMSLFMHIFGTNEIVIQVKSVLFLTISLFLLEKIVDKNICLLLLFLVFPLSLVFPSYNIFLF